MKRTLPLVALMLIDATPAFAHVGAGSATSFAAGVAHPLAGLDHVSVMLAVGLWAALRGKGALLFWPLTFVGMMLVGGALGMAHAPLPFVEPAILASVVAIGLLAAAAVDLPVSAGALIIGLFALFHGYAHGSEVGEKIAGVGYMAGFALATTTLHLLGMGFAIGFVRARLPVVVRSGGVACTMVGVGLIAGMLQ